MLNREPKQKQKQYPLWMPTDEWEALIKHLGNRWGTVAQFIREAIREKIEREKQKEE